MASSTEGANGMFDLFKSETLRAMMRDLGQTGFRKRDDMIGYLKDLSSGAASDDAQAEATSSSKSKAASKSSSKPGRSSAITAPVKKSTRFSTADAEPQTRTTRTTRSAASSTSVSSPIIRSAQKTAEASTTPVTTRSTRKSISAPVPTTPTRSSRKRKVEENEEDEDDSASAEPEPSLSGSPKRARMSTRSGKVVGDEDVEMAASESVSTGPRRGRSSNTSGTRAGSRMQVSISVSPKKTAQSRSRTRTQKREVDVDRDGDVDMDDENEQEESASTALRGGRERGRGVTERASLGKKKAEGARASNVDREAEEEGSMSDEAAVEPKRKRGRPRKSPKISSVGSGGEQEEESVTDKAAVEPKRKPGRPRKSRKASSVEFGNEQEEEDKGAETSSASQSRRPRGRPPKSKKAKSPPRSISPESPDTEEYENSNADGDADGDDDDEAFMHTVETEKITRRGRPRRDSSSTSPLATLSTQNMDEPASTSIATSRPSRTIRPPKSPIPRTLTTPVVKVKRTYSRKKKNGNGDSSARTRARSPAKPRSTATRQQPSNAPRIETNAVRARSNFVGVVLAPFSQMQLKGKWKEKATIEAGNEADEDADGEHDIDMEHYESGGNGGVVEKPDAPRPVATEEDVGAVNEATEEVAETERSSATGFEGAGLSNGKVEHGAETRQEVEAERDDSHGPAPNNAVPEPQMDARPPTFHSLPTQADAPVFATTTQLFPVPEAELDPDSVAMNSEVTTGADIGGTLGPIQDFLEPGADLGSSESELGHSMEMQQTQVHMQNRALGLTQDFQEQEADPEPAPSGSELGHFMETQQTQVHMQNQEEVPASTGASGFNQDLQEQEADPEPAPSEPGPGQFVAMQQIHVEDQEDSEALVGAAPVGDDDTSMIDSNAAMNSGVDHIDQGSDVANVHRLPPDHQDIDLTASDEMGDNDEGQLQGEGHGAQSNEIGNSESETASAVLSDHLANGGEDMNMNENIGNGGPVVKEETKPVSLTASPSFSSGHYFSPSVSPLSRSMKLEYKVEEQLAKSEVNHISGLSPSSSVATTSNLNGVRILPSADLASLASLHSLHSRPGADAGDAETYEQSYEESFEMDKRYNYGGIEGSLDFDVGNEDMLGQGNADLGAAMYGPMPMPGGAGTEWHMGMGNGEEH